jgi:hypothetical protein
MSDDLNSVFDNRIRSIVREELAEVGAGQPTTSPVTIDDKAQEQINQYLLISNKPYLNRKEAALYLDCSERSIAEWSARPVGDNPFPVSNAGSEPRYKRERIDEWAVKESTRRRLKIAG